MNDSDLVIPTDNATGSTATIGDLVCVKYDGRTRTVKGRIKRIHYPTYPLHDNNEHDLVYIEFTVLTSNNTVYTFYMNGVDEVYKIDDSLKNTASMSPDRFKALLNELESNSLETLKEKNDRYAQNGDCLHNFRSGAEIAGGTTAQACWGYATKHLVALRDMVEKNDFSNREDFLEKCQDTINYIRFLWCIGNDINNEIKEEKEKE